MRRLLLFLLLQVSIFSVGTVSAAQVYRWVDDDGTIHFSDKPPSEQGARDLEIKSYKGFANISIVPGQATTNGPTVKILSTTWCGVCKKAKTYLSQKGVAFREYDVEHSEAGKREYKRLNGKGVPIILVGDHRMDGFNRPKLEAMLRKNGLL
ncbi:MAG: glutaredoxin domain-containing protein [Acidiferrobacterales bacterium]